MHEDIGCRGGSDGNSSVFCTAVWRLTNGEISSWTFLAEIEIRTFTSLLILLLQPSSKVADGGWCRIKKSGGKVSVVDEALARQGGGGGGGWFIPWLLSPACKGRQHYSHYCHRFSSSSFPPSPNTLLPCCHSPLAAIRDNFLLQVQLSSFPHRTMHLRVSIVAS